MGNQSVARDVARSIASLRQRRGWSAAELARRAGIDARTLANVEAGANVTLATLTAIADALDLPQQQVMFGGSVAAPAHDDPADR